MERRYSRFRIIISQSIRGEQYVRKIIYHSCDNCWSVLCRRSCVVNQIEGAVIMDRLEAILSMLDNILDTRRKRHIAGGFLMSASLLFGGLAVTILTLKEMELEEETNELYLE